MKKYLTIAAIAESMSQAYPLMPFVSDGSSPIFYPKKHTVQTYRSQQRAAKKRRRANKC